MQICKMNDKKVAFVKAAREMLGEDRTSVNRAEINAVLAEYGLPNCSWLKASKMRKTRGEYWLPTVEGKYDAASVATAVTETYPNGRMDAVSVMMAPSAIGVMEEQDSYIPEKIHGYVPWGNFNMVKQVKKSENSILDNYR